MATGKRYYWIKLKESFMTSDAVDFLMGQPNGASYVVMYQMLCLKTINTGGRLSRTIGEVIIPYNEEKIQRDLKYFSIDTVHIALNLYLSLGLIYHDVDGTLVLANHAQLVGSETDWGEKKRRQRNSDSALPAGDNVPTNVPTNVPQFVPTDIDIRYRGEDIDIRERTEDICNKEDISNKDRVEDLGVVSTEPNGSVCRTKDVRRIVEAWNSLGLQQLRSVTSDSTRGGMLRARVNQYGVGGVLEAIEKIRSSEFLNGQNSNGWVITFEWFVKPNNFVKVLEGNYDDRSSAKKKGDTEEMLHDSYNMMKEWANGEGGPEL